MTTSRRDGFIPALRFASLTKVYDTVVRVTTRERRFRRELLRHAELRSGQRVLDVACGTGSLLRQAADSVGATLVGIDIDADALGRVRMKGLPGARLVRGNAIRIPFADGSFDHVLATLMLHHLDDRSRRSALAEIHRVLKPNARLHVADWRRGSNAALRTVFTLVRILDGFGNTRSHANESLEEILGHNRVHHCQRVPDPHNTTRYTRPRDRIRLAGRRHASVMFHRSLPPAGSEEPGLWR